MGKGDKYSMHIMATEKVTLSWLEDTFHNWKPKHIEPEEWTKHFFQLHIFPKFTHYAHKKDEDLIFKVFVAGDTQEKREEQWKRTCVVQLRRSVGRGLKENDIIKKYGDIMDKKEVSEFVRLLEGKKKEKGTVFYG